jgi:hypothetical protein
MNQPAPGWVGQPTSQSQAWSNYGPHQSLNYQTPDEYRGRWSNETNPDSHNHCKKRGAVIWEVTGGRTLPFRRGRSRR